MPSISDQTLTERSGQEVAERLRRSLRIRPRLEVLEGRCLLSGWNPGSELYDGIPMPSRSPAAAAMSNALRDLDPRSVSQPVSWASSDGGSASSVDQAGSGDEVWFSSRNLATMLGQTQDQYVVVPETNRPHHTLGTAQGFPNLPFVGVVGTLGSGDPIDLYRVTLNAGVVRLEFGFESNQSAPTIPVQLLVFDGSGHLLGEGALGGQGGATSLYGGLGALPAGSTVYFGITGGYSSGSAGPSTSTGYQLWVARQPNSPPTTAPSADPAGSPSAISPGLAAPPPASTGRGVQPSSGGSQATPGSPADESGGLRVAVGSPAMRSARPPGGLLSDGEPAPPAASDFHAVVNKEWDEKSPNGPAPDRGTTLSP